MKIYLVIYDNNGMYEDKEMYVDAIFDSYEKAENYCIESGYVEKKKGYFEEPNPMFYVIKDTLCIMETELNNKVEY